MTNDNCTTENEASAVKRLVIFFRRGLGMPGVWITAMFMLVIAEQINGASIFGTFWIVTCLFAYFLSRIANAVEKIAGI